MMPDDEHERQEERLERGLKETFPASDPIAVGKPTSTEAPRRPVDRYAPRMRQNISRVAAGTVSGSVLVIEFRS